jgi:hypothetical protein
MSIEEFIIAVFCLIDDELNNVLKGRRLRARGPMPGLADSEVITMEIVGEFLGIDCEKSIWQYFRNHWRALFPKMPDRSNFIRQMANLHIIKSMLHEKIAAALGVFNDCVHLIDGLPMPVCKFARAHFSKIFRGIATYGYCAAKQERYYGLKGHVVISSIGVVAAATFTGANIDERDVCPELVGKLRGLLFGDKGYLRPELRQELKENALYLQTPVRSNMQENRPKAFLRWMVGTRRLIETVIGQLTERFKIERIRARDSWHQFSRFWRKLLAHTACVRLCLDNGHEPLQFECLIDG